MYWEHIQPLQSLKILSFACTISWIFYHNPIHSKKLAFALWHFRYCSRSAFIFKGFPESIQRSYWFAREMKAIISSIQLFAPDFEFIILTFDISLVLFIWSIFLLPRCSPWKNQGFFLNYALMNSAYSFAIQVWNYKTC
jgi:hypothetical protein